MTDQAAPQAAPEGDEAAFATGFDAAPAKAAPTTDSDVTATEGQQEPAPAGESQPKTEAEPAQSGKEDAVAQFTAPTTKAEWDAAVAAAAAPLVAVAQAENRKNFGQIGEVNRALKTIQERLAAGETSRKKLTAETFKRTNEELPGIGESLAADLAEYLGSPAVAAEAAQAQAAAEARGQSFDSDAFFQTKIGPAFKEVEARAELRLVKTIHRDFDQVMASKPFTEWLSTLPAVDQKRIRESEDGFVAADAVTTFKASTAKKAQAQNRNQNRLEGALTPQGDGQPASHIHNDEDAQFSKGYASVR